MLLRRSVDPLIPASFRWLAGRAAVSSAVLLPWAGYLAATLPSSVSARRWPLAWTGLDVAIAAGLAATAWFAARHDRRLAFPAVSSAALLLAGAWFGVCTAPAGSPLTWSIIDMFIEIAEASGCLALAVAVWRDGRAGAGGGRAPCASRR